MLLVSIESLYPLAHFKRDREPEGLGSGFAPFVMQIRHLQPISLPLIVSRSSGGTPDVNQNWLVTIFFFALLLILLCLAVLIISPFLKAITWAAILAVMVYPAYAWLLKLLRGR
ncbi:MAG: hypothetical protein HYY46_01385, partial [Deltaproteobacteria bacterium]|nr:hypothetical protein [Deltaproteobacteria bacterium]